MGQRQGNSGHLVAFEDGQRRFQHLLVKENNRIKGLILCAGADTRCRQAREKTFQLLFAWQVGRNRCDVPAIASRPAAVTLLGVQSQMSAAHHLRQPGDGLISIHAGHYGKMKCCRHVKIQRELVAY
jgi:hypothetical protein